MRLVLLLLTALSLSGCAADGPVGGYLIIGDGPALIAGNPEAAQAAMDNLPPQPIRPIRRLHDRCQTFGRNGLCLENRQSDRRFDRYIYLQPGGRYVLKPKNTRFQTRSGNEVRCIKRGQPQPYVLENSEVGLRCP